MSRRARRPRPVRAGKRSDLAQQRPSMPDPSQLDRLPVTYQELTDYFAQFEKVRPFALRRETLLRVEQLTKRPLICYVAKTHHVPQGTPVGIDDSDLMGFGDLVGSLEGKAVDIFLVSNGGFVEAVERIVRLVREHFDSVRFIVPGNAYSAATLICFSGDEILMGSLSTLGPIDPQINGVPAGAILRAFDKVRDELEKKGPRALTAYMPLIAKYDLHMFEVCRVAQQLSKELASFWLRTYMLNDEQDRVDDIVNFFSNYGIHKSHGRSIDRAKAVELGLHVSKTEDVAELADLVSSLYYQFELWFEKTPFYKMFENAHGINWGRKAETITVQLPMLVPPGAPQPAPQPGPPERSDRLADM